MKKKISKIMGLSLAFVLIASMLVFAIPTSAGPLAPMAPTVSNAWEASVPTEDAAGKWFYDPEINGIGPMAQAIDGDLYAAVYDAQDINRVVTTTIGGGNLVVDITYEQQDGTTGFINDYTVLNGTLVGNTAEIIDISADCVDILNIVDAGSGATGVIEIRSRETNTLMATYDVSTTTFTDGGYLAICDIFISKDGGRTWTISTAANRYKALDVDPGADVDAPGMVVDMVCSELYPDVLYVTDGNYVYKSIDGALNWSIVAKDSLEYALRGKCGLQIARNPITCIDVGYDGSDAPQVFIGTRHVGYNYDASHPLGSPVAREIVGSVYWYEDGTFGAEWTDLQLRCYGCCMDANCWPADPSRSHGCWDAHAVACAPDFATSNKVYVVITTEDDDCVTSVTNEPRTRVIYTTGTPCAWTDVAELYWNCDPGNNFHIFHASRIMFPVGYDAASPVLFVGVADDGSGGDVYRVTEGSPIAIDLNVRPGGGCEGVATDICSLDIRSDDALMAGAWWDTNVYTSLDGGWSWDDSVKDPTGRDRTYVLWVGDSALASTRLCDCAVSMSCGTTVGEFWNQISLINMDIDYVLDLDHAPGYLDGSSIMYVLTNDTNPCVVMSTPPNTSLLRWDGTYWERVFSSFTYDDYTEDPDFYANMDWVQVSPDFNTTSCVYLANTDFRMFRTLDAGCSWKELLYPCYPRPQISAWEVVDLETVLAAGAAKDEAGVDRTGIIYKTIIHGAQPWAKCATGACNGVDFDLSPNIGTDSSVLFGDCCGNVFISQDVGTTWDEITEGAASFYLYGADTYVIFDPSYGTGSPDAAGQNMIYAAAGTDIGRCDINSAKAWDAQDWVYIKTDVCRASGIAAAGDTALYVADAGGERSGEVAICGTIAVSYTCGTGTCNCDLTISEAVHTNLDVEVLSPYGVYLDDPIYCGYPLSISDYDLACTAAGGIDGTVVVNMIIAGIPFAVARIHIHQALFPCAGCTPPVSVYTVISSDLSVCCEMPGCPTGVWRTLNPLDPVTPGPFEFEFLNEGLTEVLLHPEADNFSCAVYPDDLWLTAGSNVLWALGDITMKSPTDTIWTWDDPLATPVIQVSPADEAKLVTTESVTLEWTALDGATLYEVLIYSYCPECPTQKSLQYKIVTTETCLIVGAPAHPLVAGTKYYWKVRVALGSPFLSKWSALHSFDTALSAIPNLCSPACGGRDIVLTTNFTWDAVSGATGYEVQVAKNEGFSPIVTSGTATVNAWVPSTALDYSTTYYWRVRAVKDGVPGAWSVCLFTTEAAPAAAVYTCAACGLTFDTEAELQAHWNAVHAPVEPTTPLYIWIIIGIGAALVIAVISLIVTTRRPS